MLGFAGDSIGVEPYTFFVIGKHIIIPLCFCLTLYIPKLQNFPPAPAVVPIVADKPVFAKPYKVSEKPRVVKVLHTHVGNGQCVALPQSLGFSISGNASAWPKNAKLAGYTLSIIPKIGAIAVTRESSYGASTGHVTGAVQRIENGYVYIQEQNYRRFTITEGWLPLSKVVTFIYPKGVNQA